MPLISAFRTLSPLGGAVNPRLCAHLTAFNAAEIIGWPPGYSLVSPGRYRSIETHWPVEANGRSISGWRSRAYSDDYYHRIHMVPAEINLGNLVSSQTRDILLWNAFFTPKTVQSVSDLEEGITLAPPSPLPLVMGGLQEQAWRLSVVTSGPATIDANIIFGISGVPTMRLKITGNRIVPFPALLQDWSEPVTETLAWLTDIRQSHTGAEQRRALRIAPRRRLEARLIAEGAGRAWLDLAFAAWGARAFAIPLWPDSQRLASALPAGAVIIPCRTAGFDFVVGGLALLLGRTAMAAEAVEIAAIRADAVTIRRPVQSAWPAGTAFFPARTARLAEPPQLQRHTDRLGSAHVVFDVLDACDWPEQMPVELWRGRPVFSARPDESSDISPAFERLLSVLDNDIGRPAVMDTANRPFAVQQHHWLLRGREEHGAFRSLLYALRGQQKTLWLPTHADDLQMTTIASGRTLTVRNVGYARFGVGLPGRRDIRIERIDAPPVCARVVNAAADGETESLVLESDLAAPIVPESVRRICYLGLFRLADDAVKIEHLTDADGLARASLTFRAVRDDLEAA